MRRLLLSLAATALLTACSNGGDGTPTTSENAEITLTASAAAGTVARGSSATTTLTVGLLNSQNGSVSLTSEGAPAGVSVQFVPSALSAGNNTSLATISVDVSAQPGISVITLRASATGAVSKIVAYTLTIPTPAITLTAGSGTTTAVQGTSITVPITLTRINGASGPIALAATGLPTDATAGFTPSPIPGVETTSTLSIFVASTTPVGTYPIVVTATGAGLATQTSTFQLSVTAPNVPAYTLAAAPAAVAVVAGQSATSTLTVTKSGGFAGNVTLALEGAPAGVTGSFAPNPATATTSTLTINTTGAAVAGTFNLTIRGTAAGLTDRTIPLALTINAASGVTVALTPATLSIAQGASGQTAVAVTRVGALTGDVVLTASGTPTGATVAFAPATVSGAASTMTVTTTAAVPPGTYQIIVTGTGAGGVSGTAALNLSITAASGFSLSATNASIAQNASGASTVTITRAPGYVASVDLTVSNLPANVTATLNPASVSSTSSTLNISVGAAAVPGAYTLTISGAGAGAGNQSTTLTLTVTAGTGGGGSVAWRFCDATRVPLWFAYRNGTSGSWVRVTPSVDNTFAFTLSGTVGGVAYVLNQSGGGTLGVVFLNTTTELTNIATSECTANPGNTTKSVNGTFAGLVALQSGTAYMGGGTGTATGPATAFQFTNVADRLTDILAVRVTTSLSPLSVTPDRGILRRGVNYAAASTAPVLDFAGAESFAIGSATITLANGGADNTSMFTSFRTTNGAVGTVVLAGVGGTGSSLTAYGVPASNTQPGDFHQFFASASSGTSAIRTVTQYNRDLSNRTITFGAPLNTPTVTTTGVAPYARIKVRGNWQSEYGEAAGTAMIQSTGTPRSWSFNGSRGYFGAGATEYEFELDDFSGVAGFQNIWGLSTGVLTSVNTSATGAISGGINVIGEGNAFKTASRVQSVTP